MDYAGLKTAINNWSERSYDDTQLNEFIDLAEAAIRRRLVGYQREVTSSLTAGSDSYINLPSDFLGLRAIYQDTTPYKWTISGEKIYVVDGASLTFDVTYYAKLPALSDSNTTNWLIETAPDVYLFMCRAYQSGFTEDPNAAAWETRAFEALDALNIQNTVAQYSRTGYQTRGATP